MLKLLAAAILFALPLTAFASLDQDEVKKSIAGQYRLEEGQSSMMFVIRSSGAVEVPENSDFPYASGRLTFNFSTDDYRMDGLPVAHVVIGVGSDEDVVDYHLLLGVSQLEGSKTVQLVASFATFNDGPNSLSDVGGRAFKISKYNKDSGKYEQLH